MYKGRSNLLPVALLVIVAIVAIIAMVSLGRLILRGDSGGQVIDDAANRALLNTEADRSVSMTVRGPIVADEEFRSYEIEISPIGRTMTTYKGYKNEILEVSRLTNSTTAYTEFVNALNKADFSNKVLLVGNFDEVEGICASGRLYTFEMLQAQSVTDQSWTTSCKGIAGSFKGNAVTSRDLFLDQIPDNKELLDDIDI